MIAVCKIKIVILVASFSLLQGIASMTAQEVADCNSNSLIFHKAVLYKHFEAAYLLWKSVIDDCPTLHFYTFTDGFRILKGLMSQVSDKNDPQYRQYLNELMHTYDLSMNDTDVLGYSPGDRIIIGGWIGEPTTIR